MGFFSRIKKLWGADGEPRDEAISPQAPEQASDQPLEQTPEQAPTQTPLAAPTIPEIEEEPEAQPPHADSPPPAPPEPEHEAQPAARADAPGVDTEARKESGWRRLFGLGGKTEEKAPAAESAPREEPRPAPAAEMLFQEKPVARDELAPWQKSLQQALGEAEPKLSTWMVHILDGVTRRGDVLWERLRFLFAQLEVPAEEAQDFIRRFDKWLLDMEYDHVDEFRSELQYRMALALELEDEEDERNRLFLKLSAGLGKTREQLTMRIDQLLSMTGKYDDAFWEELEEILLMADVGVNATQELSKRLRPKLRQAAERDAATFKTLMKEELASVFIEPKTPKIPQLPEVVLMIGVNGAGKTTTIAKLAHRAQMQGRKVLVAAGDTFRAAAIEQLQVWSKRVGAGFYAKAHGSDPAAVAFEAVEYAMREGYDLVFVDTAGRLQTKHNLMEELKKINRVLGKKLEGAPHRTILVLDSTTGQNALSQVKLFSQASPVDEIVLTKLDGTAKGGIIVAIALEFKIPISFVGLGEKMEDLRPFSGQEFASALFD
ncbi:fused signal recognition particle receptor [Desulfomicrobium apsheronum]|uniref:Signal recognition particle receptor FtsY n=1 Tax=Desulfomicrobium apsheronum TaxID=52560 RepID=A0A1I3X549_9BACT|nr:signal recognition particle-docking protein FtsY [Desulfomicrobium apsheronum]SFK14694.1 fused signal recognition particle receptor [Desulfomicrobium apsheronum]